jgi:4-hydroxy-tetrahydrodipicolinate synthase
MNELTGVICAQLTPFVDETGLIDGAWLPDHLAFLRQHHISGVLTLGTTGEGPSLSLTERQQIIDLVLSQRENLSVIAGTGCAALPETIALSRYALQKGADAVLVMPPFYFKNVRDSGVLAYYRALCDALPEDARLLVYNFPKVTAVSITPHIIEGLLESHPRQFYGMKDSSGNREYLLSVIKNYPSLRIFVGNESLASEGLAAGAAGLISATCNVWPDMLTAVLQAHQHGENPAIVQERLSALSGLMSGYVPPRLKAVLPWVSELPRTSVRAPLGNLTDAEAAQLRADLERLELL